MDCLAAAAGMSTDDDDDGGMETMGEGDWHLLATGLDTQSSNMPDGVSITSFEMCLHHESAAKCSIARVIPQLLLH